MHDQRDAAGFLQRLRKRHHTHNQDNTRPVDRFICAFSINTAKFSHQQAGDNRRDRVGNFIGQHQRHHQYQAENGVRRLAVRRRGFADLDRHIQHHKVAAFLPQQAD
ncbi:Uncharacterised protein [Salmonella enterica subsp. enterica serovar Bovismorbificans]|uniref:Uncharacterized protein n=1 Tax=Salmonella enterica subsp. enterica serovar Bovismorbificans TaxID=58097 RepID=A0A655EBG6_SALET|nr:Uncharacterised protein [Salmonella enterica subsp. enterica serovar Bovismorbificans]